MSTKVIFGAVGAVIGFYMGGPQGAYYGWTVGSTFGGVADPGTIKGPSVQDLATQTAQEGGSRPIVFARSPPMAGNVIASSPPKRVKRKKKQGKGGGPTVEYETILRSYAIGVCEGPIDRFVRIWRNGELVYSGEEPDEYNFYDPRNTTVIGWAIRIKANIATFLQRTKFYLGTFDQNPDPFLEENFGVGTTPSHRGTAYIVVVNDDLTDFRGAIPQYVFQVEKKIEGEDRIVYLEGEYLWEKPDGLDHIRVRAIGAGGGGSSGGGGPNIGGDGGGGAGGGFAEATFVADDLKDTEVVSVEGIGIGHNGVLANLGGNNGLVGEPGGHAVFGDTPEKVRATGGGGGIPYTGGGPSNANGGQGFVVPDTAPDHIQATDIVLDTGSNVSKESPNPPTATTWAGGGGGRANNVFGVGFPGSVPAHADDADEFTGGRGGAPGVSAMNADGTDGLDGDSYGGGGGMGGNTGISDGPGPYVGGKAGNGGPAVVVVDHFYADEDRTGLQTVVMEICRRVGLPPEKVDVSKLHGRVFGFAFTNQYPATEALRALSQIFLFDAVSEDGLVRFVPRGLDTVATITEAEFVDADDDADVEQKKRSDSLTIPRVMNLNYYDVQGSLNTDKQTSERFGDRRAVGEMQLTSPVLMSADQAKRALIINHKVYAEDQKGELKFYLADNYVRFSPADALFVQWQGRTERARIAQVAIQDGFQEYTLVIDRQTAYVSRAEGFPAAPQLLPSSIVPGPTLILPLDLPILQDVDDAVGLSMYIGVSGASDAWTGALIEWSYDGGANYVGSRDARLPVAMGHTVTTLADHPAEYPDYTNTVRVQIDTPDVELEATDMAGVLNGANRCVIDGEILQFMGADEISDGVWELSGLLRGRKYTSTEAHGINAPFVMLEDLSPFAMSLTDLGRTITFRATSYGTDVSTATVVSFVYTGQSQTEFPVGYLEGHRDGDNLEVTWQGAGRLGGGGTVAQGARFAGYRVRFTAGVSPPVVISVDTMAQALTQDVSSLSGPVTVSVVQLNDLTGEGPAVEVVVE